MKVLLWCFWRVNSYFCTEKVSSTHFIMHNICTPSRVGSPVTHSGLSPSSIPLECHTSMDFTSIWIWPTVWAKLIPYKTIKSEGYGSRDYDDLMDLNFCTQIEPIKYFSIPRPPFLLPHVGLQRSAHKTRMDKVRLPMSQPPSSCMYISCKEAPFLF